MPGIPCGIQDWQAGVLRVGITIEDDVVPNFGNVKGPVHFGFVVAGHALISNARAVQAKETVKKIACVKRFASRTPDHGSPSESEFQEWEDLDVNLLPVNKRSRDIRMAVKPAKELVDTHWPEVREKTRQAEWFRIHQPDHVDGLDGAIPNH